jgi:hypothetical protein
LTKLLDQDYVNGIDGVYLHPIITEVIRSTLFSGATSIGVKHPKFFPDVLPLPTLALALTAVRVSPFVVLDHLLK